MPINTDLNTAPYFDDFDIEKQYYKVLFKPGFAVQAREMTQLQTILQSQIEQFGDNIFKEGSIIKGCNFTALNDLRHVKVNNDIDPTAYISRRTTELIGQTETQVDYVFELVGSITDLRANVVSASRGFTASLNPNTFYINYLNTTGTIKEFQDGEDLTVNLYKFKVEDGAAGSAPFETILDFNILNVNTGAPLGINVITGGTGQSFGIQSSPGITFQKGHFLFATEQTLIVSKYDNVPTNVSVGYRVQERLLSALNDSSLYDNANGSNNENAAGADRLSLVPTLVVLDTAVADADPSFFALIRYQEGNEITLRDVSQYNVLGDELAKRTFEESGNYILNDFAIKTDRRDVEGTDQVKVLVGTGTAYIKGYRVENSGERSFTIDQVDESTGWETQPNQPVSFNYGSYVDIITHAGKVDMNSNETFNLLDSGLNIIGTTFVTNLTPTRLYLYGTRLNATRRFSEVYRVDSVSNGHIVVGNGSIVPSLKEARKSPLVFDTGMFSLRKTGDEVTGEAIIPVRVQENQSHVAGSFTLNALANQDFAVDNSDLVVVDGSNTYQPVLTIGTTNNDSILTFTVDAGAANPCTVYYNKRLQTAATHAKLREEPHVSITFDNTKTKFSLGFPDVYEIISIRDPGTTIDYTDSFRLKTNQKDQYYDHSYIEVIQGRAIPPNGVTLVANVKVFKLNTTQGQYYFTINSYPTADPLFNENNIPVYEGSNRIRYNLRECFDFRPYVDLDPALTGGGDPYTTTTSVSPVGPITADVGDIAPTFITNGRGLNPALNTTATADISTYLSRIDLITADSYGEINIVKGKEARFAVPPSTSSDKLPIAEVFVPGYPALSAQDAANSGRNEYAVKAKAVGTKNYTMKDIKGLERKIDNLVYYVSLSQLESATQDLSILDENGLSRFKNGFLADPFNDLSLADVRNPKFSAAVPFNEKILMPAVKSFPLDLKFKAGSGISTFPPTADPRVATIGRDADVSILNQPYASEFRNCVSNFWKFSGDGVVSPPYDAAYDTTTNPLNLEIDLVTPFQDFVENLQQFIPLTDTSVSTRMDFEDFWERGQGVETTRNRSLGFTEQTGGGNVVGEFVTNFQFQPYMASRDIKVYMSGLRPNTRHYFFFDEVSVDQHIIPGTLVDAADDIERNGVFGQVVETDSNGVLRAVFRIPDATFFVGDRVLDIVDVDQYDSIDSGSTSRGFVTYRAYNFSVEKAALTPSTRVPDFDITTTTTTRNLPRRPRGGRDPLAQTFFVKEGMGQGSNSVFLSKVDVYFKRVSEVNGVTLMIREVINGYPSSVIVPFSKVHFTATYLTNQTNGSVSDDAGLATTFTFEAPVRLDVEKEYCIVVMPDANDPNYLIYTSKVGGTDLSPGPTQGQSIVQDWGDGVLFTSTNNKAWKSYQDEDIKFNMYRHNFIQAPTIPASVTLTQRDHEFLTVTDFTGRFNVGEFVYQETAAEIPSTLGQGSILLTVAGIENSFAVGDYALVRDAGSTRFDIFKIVSTGVDEVTVNKPCSFAGVAATPIVAGKVSYYNKREPNQIHLESSSARATKIFSTGNIVTGFDSGTTATIVTVDNINLSYVQPMIIKSNDSVSSTDISGSFLSPNDVGVAYDLQMSFNDNNHFNTNGVVLYSKSNDVTGIRAFDITIAMENALNSTSTAFIDIEVSKLIAHQYKITNDPVSTSSFISKTIELAEDLDAEDLQLIITGYRPNGTDIKTYIRPQNEFDSSDFESIDWIELELYEGVGVFSSTTNINDYREYKYRVPATAKTGQVSTGALTYDSKAGRFDGYRKFAIRIDMLAETTHSVPTLQDYRGIALT